MTSNPECLKLATERYQGSALNLISFAVAITACVERFYACCILVRSDLGSQFFLTVSRIFSGKHIWRICVSIDYVRLNPGSSRPDESTWHDILVNFNSNWFVDYIGPPTLVFRLFLKNGSNDFDETCSECRTNQFWAPRENRMSKSFSVLEIIIHKVQILAKIAKSGV